METVLFLDVDGTILPSSHEEADRVEEIDIPHVIAGQTKTVHGFTWTEQDKVIFNPRDIPVKESIVNFLTEVKDKVKIVWLTGWEENAHMLEPFFNLPECEVLFWDKEAMSFHENEKKDALKFWLKQHPEVKKFIWADDCAPLAEDNFDLEETHEVLIITPDPVTAINNDEIVKMTNFII